MAEAATTPKEKAKTAEIDLQDTERQLYELAYMLRGTLEEEKARDISSSIRSIIEKKHAIIVEDTAPKLRKLAYTIKDHTEGFFGWLTFLAKSSDSEDIKKQTEKKTEVIRFLITKGYQEERAERRVKTRKKIMTEEEKGKIEEIDKKLEEILGK